jgi:ElaB/YqjD/DUF883 family membrane-anchored ribosome-binding protein
MIGVHLMSIQQLADELAGLKDELGSVARDYVAATATGSHEKIAGATKFLDEALQDIEQFVASEEEHLENAISSHPLASVAAAFVAGLAIGLILRRR